MKVQAAILPLILLALPALGKYNGPTNQDGLNLIKEFEGFRANFYTDPVGIRTIGYGHACHVSNCNVPINGKYPVPLSLQNGENLLKDDLQSYEDCVKNAISYSNLNANQFSSLVSFTFNLGCGSLRSSTLRTLLNNGNVDGASKEFAKWVHGGGRVLPGLVRRREAERVLFCSGGVCNGGGGGNQCVGKSTTVLNLRASPNTSSAVVGSLANGQTATITERVSGTNVSGNNKWFRIANGYVSAYYVQVTSSNGQSWCSS